MAFLMALYPTTPIRRAFTPAPGLAYSTLLEWIKVYMSRSIIQFMRHMKLLFVKLTSKSVAKEDLRKTTMCAALHQVLSLLHAV